MDKKPVPDTISGLIDMFGYPVVKGFMDGGTTDPKEMKRLIEEAWALPPPTIDALKSYLAPYTQDDLRAIRKRLEDDGYDALSKEEVLAMMAEPCLASMLERRKQAS